MGLKLCCRLLFPDLRLKGFGRICVRDIEVVSLYELWELGIILLGG